MMRHIIIAVAWAAIWAAVASAQPQAPPSQNPPWPILPAPVERSDTDIINVLRERDRRYEQRFLDLERQLATAVQSIKENTAAALSAQDKQTAAQFTATKEAVTKAENAAEKRFDSVNEFRNTLKDQQARFIEKAEVEVRLKNVTDRLDELRAAQTNIQSRAEGAASLWALIAGAVALLIAGIVAVVSVVRAAKA